MIANQRGDAGLLPEKLPPIMLRRGQVIWVLTKLGYGAGVSYETFYEYIKSLRKLGIPFEFGSDQSRARARARYSYADVMELAITLSLRIYHVVPDALLRQMVQYRPRLQSYYRKAYAARCTGRGSPIHVELSSNKFVDLRGLFLDLGVSFSGGKLVRFGPPKLLSPTEALHLSAQRLQSVQMLLPLNISILAERVVALSSVAPTRSRATTV